MDLQNRLKDVAQRNGVEVDCNEASPLAEMPAVRPQRMQYAQPKQDTPITIIVCFVGGAVFGALATWALMPTPEPQIVEKPVIVDRYCILFCGGQKEQ